MFALCSSVRSAIWKNSAETDILSLISTVDEAISCYPEGGGGAVSTRKEVHVTEWLLNVADVEKSCFQCAYNYERKKVLQ